jgi:UDP-N-acetylmuramoyl-tripeptide--D-alanyl-D-alanine ligase
MTGGPDLWTAEEMARVTSGQANGTWTASGLSIDTRTLKRGDVFVALRGPNFDGHNFLDHAFENGAAAVVIDSKAKSFPIPPRSILVKDTLRALNDLGTEGRRRSSAKIIAITGSAGKTSTKDALSRSLSRQGKTTSSLASLNNYLGVPLSLARMKIDDQYGIFEIGMNRTGEISALSKMVSPDLAIITNVEPAHIGNFPSIEAIASAKAEICDGLDKYGTVILNADNHYTYLLIEAAQKRGIKNIITFGTSASADAKLLSMSSDSQGSSVEADIRGRHVCYRLNLPGRHHVMNSLASLAAITAVDADLSMAVEAFGEISALPGRGKQHLLALKNGQITLIDESYNANPASMRAALEILGTAKLNSNGRRIAVLGEMLELGANSQIFHLNLLPILLDSKVDVVHLAGGEMLALFDVLPESMRGIASKNIAKITNTLISELRHNDIVLVKGSYASGAHKIVTDIKKRFPEVLSDANSKDSAHAL